MALEEKHLWEDSEKYKKWIIKLCACYQAIEEKFLHDEKLDYLTFFNAAYLAHLSRLARFMMIAESETPFIMNQTIRNLQEMYEEMKKAKEQMDIERKKRLDGK